MLVAIVSEPSRPSKPGYPGTPRVPGTRGDLERERVGKALAWLDGHISWESAQMTRARVPTLDRMRDLVRLMGDPQDDYEVIHLTGTNGKGSTARMITSLLISKGLSVGTYTSPNLSAVNERMTWNSEPIPDEDLADLLASLEVLEGACVSQPTRFEILTAAALRWFADIAVDVAVLEVGIGGLWDATNVADASVACVTNVGYDHVEILGPELSDIAREKAGIVKSGCTLVLGETDPELAAIFRRSGAARVIARNEEFGCESNSLAFGGRLVDVRTPYGLYEGIYVPLHGAHQGDNAAVALAAVDAFFDAPCDIEVAREAFQRVEVPGRVEVVMRNPLCVLDGAHNVAGAEALADAVSESFTASTRKGVILVIGLLQGRNPVEMIEAIGPDHLLRVIACMPASPRAMPARDVAEAALSLGVRCEVASSVAQAVEIALERASVDVGVIVTGSLYVVAEARSALASGSRNVGSERL